MNEFNKAKLSRAKRTGREKSKMQDNDNAREIPAYAQFDLNLISLRLEFQLSPVGFLSSGLSSIFDVEPADRMWNRDLEHVLRKELCVFQ